MNTPGGVAQTKSMWANKISRRARHPSAAARRRHAAVPDGRSLLHAGCSRPQRPRRRRRSAQPEAMNRAIREHLRDFIAIVDPGRPGAWRPRGDPRPAGGHFPAWVPILGSDRFELKAEFTTAQAVTPGQGQSATIAGIKVGEVEAVDLDNGHAVVTMDVDHKYAPLIHPDATLLLRPRTGLNDMVIEVDPGTAAGEIKEGSTVPLAQTAAQRPAGRDPRHARRRHPLLPQAAAPGRRRGPAGRERAASWRRRCAGSSPPPATSPRSTARSRSGAEHRRVITTSACSAGARRTDAQLARFVDSSNAVLGSFADQEAAIRAAAAGAARDAAETRGALRQRQPPRARARPGAAGAAPGGAGARARRCRSPGRSSRETVGPIRNQIRPFTRAGPEAAASTSSRLAKPLDRTIDGPQRPASTTSTSCSTSSPTTRPARRRGLPVLGRWLNHNTNAVFLTQDAAARCAAAS